MPQENPTSFSNKRTLDPAMSLGRVSELLRRKDTAALNELMEWYRPVLKAVADRSIGIQLQAKLDASDVVQEACSDVAYTFATLETSTSRQFWKHLRLKLYNRIKEARRRYLRTKMRNGNVENVLSKNESALTNVSFRNQVAAIDGLIQNEMETKVLEAMMKLPRELKRVLRWRFRKGWTYKQIGEQVGRSEDDVRMLISRCLDRIRSEITDHG